MKALPAVLYTYMQNRAGRRKLKVLATFLCALLMLVVIYSVLFHVLMAWEGHEYSWLTGVYWTLTVMTTLGFGDITFHTDLGRLYSIVVLLSGTLFMLTLLPFTFIQFFYGPWMEAQAAALAPRELPKKNDGPRSAYSLRAGRGGANSQVGSVRLSVCDHRSRCSRGVAAARS